MSQNFVQKRLCCVNSFVNLLCFCRDYNGNDYGGNDYDSNDYDGNDYRFVRMQHLQGINQKRVDAWNYAVYSSLQYIAS